MMFLYDREDVRQQGSGVVMYRVISLRLTKYTPVQSAHCPERGKGKPMAVKFSRPSPVRELFAYSSIVSTFMVAHEYSQFWELFVVFKAQS